MSKKINPLNIARLRENEYYQFLVEFVALVSEAIVSRNISDNINSLVKFLKELMTELDKALMYLSTSELTIPVAEADSNRDMTYRGFVLYVEAFEHSIDEEKREAARRIQVLIHNYGDFRKRPYNDETAVMENFIQDLKNMHTDNMQIIGANVFFDEMRQTNKIFKNLIDERHDERVAQAREDVRVLRPQIDELYHQIVTLIEVGNRISDESMYTDLINKINERIHYYKTTLSTRQGRADAKKEEEGGEEGGEDVWLEINE